ncbi:acetyltransferase [Lachnospiraceae bacterium 54-53]
MKKKIILLGGGGHAKSVMDSIRTLGKYRIAGILDDPEKAGSQVLGVKITGSDRDLKDLYKKGIRYAAITVGSVGNTGTRRKLYELCKEAGYELPNIMDKSSLVSGNLRMGEGNFIGKGAVIGSGVVMGNGCIVNTGAILEHGCRLGDFVHIAPGSVLCGNVRIGENTHIGAHSTVIQDISIGNDTVIGAGSLVLKNISPNQLAYGSPAKEATIHE